MEITIRKANKFDLNCIKNLLEQLTVVGTVNHINDEVFDNIYVACIDDVIVGCVTLIIENKIIHSGGRVGHIEDVVVDNKYRKLGIGKVLIDHSVGVAKEKGCYKVILDCDCENILFYEKCGFKVNGVCMRFNF